MLKATPLIATNASSKCNSRSRDRGSLNWVLLCLALACWLAMAPATTVLAQKADAVVDEGIPLIDTPPYDVIVLTEAAGGKSVKIAPIRDRNLTQRPADTVRLEVTLLSHPDRRYEILWRDIARIDLFERMIYDEALKKLSEKDFVTAFMNLSFLMRNYPKTANLEKLRRDFLFQSAAMMFAESRSDFSRYFQTLSTLEELRNTAPDFEQTSVTQGLSRVSDALLRHYQEKGDLSSAKKLLERLEKTYGESLPTIVQWKNQFLQMAEDRKKEAIELMNAGKYRQARQAALDMSNISSSVQGGAELMAEIRRRHPMVRVGVLQKAGQFDPSNLFSWSSRRAGSLVYRPVMRFLQTGTSGGRYQFALGKMKQSEDNLQLSLTIDPKIEAGLTGYDLAQILSNRATPGDKDYDASWAAIVQSIASPGPTQVVVRLQKPYVLPHALMQFTLPDSRESESPLPGAYRFNESSGNETSFVLRNSKAASDQLLEIVEVFYEDPKSAVNDLLRGEIDAIDQLYPSDARRLSSSKQVGLGTYALPTVHMLVPISDHAYLAKDKFRRALMYASNRNAILEGELIASDDVNDGRLISGPFPLGSGENDPLNYAYDTSIEPLPYEPRLAKLLLYMAEKDVVTQSQKMKVPVPENTKLRVAVPDFEVAKVAVEALIQQWSLVGIKAEAVVLSEGRAFDPNLKCDLVYVMAQMWEPAVDIERLLGGNGPASSNNAFIIQGLTRLRQARTWRDTRTALRDLHRLVDNHLPILPLWQVTDRFAYTNQLTGLKSGVVSLYDNINAWKLVTPGVSVASSAGP